MDKIVMKPILLFVFVFGFSGSFCAIFAQDKETYQLSSHILDISKGVPVSDVEIVLEKYNSHTKTWKVVNRKVTDKNGRVSAFLPYHKITNKGIYKFKFLTENYFQK